MIVPVNSLDTRKSPDTARYKRHLSPEYEDLLNKDLHFVISDTYCALDDPDALDIQIREDNKVMLYHGGTRILVLHYSSQCKSPIPVSLACTNKFYRNMKEFISLEIHISNGDIRRLRSCYSQYLQAAVKKIDDEQPKWYRKEGFWQNNLSRRYGMHNNDMSAPLLLIDREAVLGFKDKAQKEVFYNNIISKHNDFREKMRRSNPKDFGAPGLQRKSFGDECDFLALDRSGNLVCLEIKHGSNYEGIYWGLLQANVYCQAFKKALKQVKDDIASLVTQKERLGLLPTGTEKNFLAEGIRSVEGILGVTEHDFTPNYVWKRLDEVSKNGGDQIVQKVAIFGDDGSMHIHNPSQIYQGAAKR